MKKYDYVIAGGGMSGLSLAYYLTLSPLRDRSVLIIDKEAKDTNDRTWCFWERGEGPFEPILFRKWNTVDFYGTTLSGPLNIGDYQYKMLRGIDFYDHVRAHLANFPNIEFRQGTINRLINTADGGFLIVDDEPIVADFIFDSTYPLNLKNPDHHNLLQHFKGWVITTEKPCFDVNRPRMMDFRVAQQGDCRFLYVLPFNEKTAMVEYTIFNEKLLAPEEYETSLRTYIDQFLDTGTYQISETEFGVIPMSDEPAPENPADHIVRIGTSGGYTKPSTGYTFQRTQHYLRELVNMLAATGRPERRKSWFTKPFKGLLDSVLLNVLQNKRHPADDIFTRLYERNPPARIFRFLDEDTSLWEDLLIMSSVPLGPFTIGAFDVFRKRLF
ncbi:lycopene cyclase family protein [Fibrella forsythiae]|uniref:Lycopene cyclase n=1 Tax=Fibrella forsythiae TaxID=2817061 RepID=A0ABS3JKW9_9BACT|nr:lycopene cyclase family protein [Fibrella forsythiae]MBO0950637.1 lycopene cyclase [Fibrella forsythiae]